ncbi:MerR family transcriptional regulator [Eubacterium sp. CAG:161]|uniref:MerR family transcriptional regulator n=1 Tax=Eubacterium sp. CAG:161 TaxID=1262881 RepID=UPI0003398500|nr:MerR family transcriptional regulator [Eubacterium sp. CAG:161]CCY69713.1 transcriptional regulator MerR family [Eubacterium sp. CAG:161]
MTIKEVSEKYDISSDTLRYYERIGMIPEVTRTASGIRDYQESDLSWVELVICMRKAGVSVESLIEYVKMCMQGDTTFSERLHLLQEEKEKLEEQRSQLETAMKRLDYKISRYQKAVDTGELNWDKDTCNND